ncbi:hypothetical protein I4U23_021126 [Adineta vaga]|nr:hypothetical protein I4U23_021126 [Adineta vaga]
MMRLKFIFPTTFRHHGRVDCIGWMSTDDLYSVGEDHIIYKYNIIQNELIEIAELAQDLYALDMHWLPKGTSASSKRSIGSDLFVLATSDGKFCLMNKTGRVEKMVEAHQGATICVRWNSDGSQLATGGEDGQIRIWARSGMLRSNLVQSATPIFCICWSADNDAILYCTGKHLVIKSFSLNSKPNTWKAHDQFILKCDWNTVNNLIISGGEDCRYRIWDIVGRPLYTSQIFEYPITSLAWAPDGLNFAVGSYNTIRLCDSVGWCHSVEKFKDGSIFSVSWSSDSTQLACGCGAGRVGVGHIIERRMNWHYLEFVLTDPKVITVSNCETELIDKIELKDRLVNMSVSFGYLIVLTNNQGLIYNCKQFGHPAVFDLRDISMNLIVQAEKNTVSLSLDTIAVRDSTDSKSIIFFDINGKPIVDGKPISHTHEINYLALNPTGPIQERKLAFVDKFQDLFLTNVHTAEPNQRIRKLCTNITSFHWNEINGMLAAIIDGKLNIWLYPNVMFIYPNLLNQTIYRIESNNFGKNPSIIEFHHSQITIRKSTGALIQCAIPIYYELCLNLLIANRADEALQLCQYISDDSIYALIAVISLSNRDFDSAENTLAHLLNTEMVFCLQNLRSITSKEEREAEIVLITGGNLQEVEGYYLQANKPLHAIILHLNEHNWNRAIDLTQRYPQYLEIVVGYRQKYLNEYGNGKKETNSKYLQAIKTINIDWNRISAKLRKDLGDNYTLKIID